MDYDELRSNLQIEPDLMLANVDYFNKRHEAEKQTKTLHSTQ